MTVFTNGCFDIFHAGHADLLKKCRTYGDYVVVGLNSDRSVKLLKGDTRPICKEHDRKRVLEACRYVDMVIVFDDLTPYNLILEIKPDIVVKGEDWKGKCVTPEGFEGRVVYVNFGIDISTSKIVRKMYESYAGRVRPSSKENT